MPSTRPPRPALAGPPHRGSLPSRRRRALAGVALALLLAVGAAGCAKARGGGAARPGGPAGATSRQGAYDGSYVYANVGEYDNEPYYAKHHLKNAAYESGY